MTYASNARAVFGVAVLAALTAALAAGCASKPADSSGAAPVGKGSVTTAGAPPTMHGSAPIPAATATVPSSAGSTWISGQPPGQNTLDAAIQIVEPMLKHDFASSYAGLELQQPAGPADKTPYALVIYRIPGSGLDAAVRHALPTTNVVFKDSEYNAVDAQQVCDKISADTAYWQSKGLRINEYGPWLDGRAEVGVDDPGKWAAAIAARYGADRVVVNKVGPIVAD
ncbi:hypothetical protein [Catenulispora pinisilvae]|uniref:hypothetical protein n=1 Tax=Catenulispora pinisilvae TaxID=2705253 RepID=UPI001890BB86|nr:hypothetical protein [Catenulispora pinisilvae]